MRVCGCPDHHHPEGWRFAAYALARWLLKHALPFWDFAAYAPCVRRRSLEQRQMKVHNDNMAALFGDTDKLPN